MGGFLAAIGEETNSVVFPKYVKSIFSVSLPEKINDITFPEYVGWNYYVRKSGILKDVVFPKYIFGSISLSEVNEIQNVIFPEQIYGDITMSNLKKASSSTLPTIVDGDIYMLNLEQADDFRLSSKVGILDLGKITNLEGVIVPNDFKCSCVNSSYITKEDLINKSLEHAQVGENHKRMGFSNIYILALFTYVSSLLLTLIGFLLFK